MVETAKRPDLFKGRGTKWFVLGIGIVASAGAVAGAIAAESLLPLVLFLNAAALIVMAAIGLRVDGSSQELRRAASELAALAARVARLERQSPGPGGSPVLRSAVAEVTGTMGLLGGVVRELARNVAAQNRDVADLKSTLRPAGPDPAGAAPALRVGPETRAPAASPAQEAAEPEPCLLPLPPGSGQESRERQAIRAFETGGVELHLQPVVALPRRKVCLYEALARLRLADGTLIGPAEFLPALERAGHARSFDGAMLDRAIAVARHLAARRSEASVAVNLSPRSLGEPGFLNAVLRRLETAPEVAGRIVLEWPQACWRALDPEGRDAVFALGGLGIPLSVDGVRDLHLDVRTLAEQGVRFVKIPAETILAASDADGSRGPDVRDLAAHLRRSGIRLVAERVEREEAVPALAELGVPLAQGFVFAAPRAVRAEVLAEVAGASGGQGSGPASALRRAG
ncbi:EAL domain-containing protein [Microvirga thermotolerans]|nr:EAL domain-containing protein [Microvirga thermotolerans]